MVCILFREIMTLKNYSQQFLLLLKVNRKGTQKSHDLIHSIMKSKDVWGVSKKIRVDPYLSGPQYSYKHNIFTYIYFLLYLL